MIDSLYRGIVLDHYKNPRNKGLLNPADASYEDVNPLCGDEVRIDVRVKNDQVDAIAFSGRGCAVSQAFASMLTELATGMPLDSVAAMTRDDFLDAIGIQVSSARRPCALLALNALKTGLFGDGDDER